MLVVDWGGLLVKLMIVVILVVLLVLLILVVVVDNLMVVQLSQCLMVIQVNFDIVELGVFECMQVQQVIVILDKVKCCDQELVMYLVECWVEIVEIVVCIVLVVCEVDCLECICSDLLIEVSCCDVVCVCQEVEQLCMQVQMQVEEVECLCQVVEVEIFVCQDVENVLISVVGKQQQCLSVVQQNVVKLVCEEVELVFGQKLLGLRFDVCGEVFIFGGDVFVVGVFSLFGGVCNQVKVFVEYLNIGKKGCLCIEVYDSVNGVGQKCVEVLCDVLVVGGVVSNWIQVSGKKVVFIWVCLVEVIIVL